MNTASHAVDSRYAHRTTSTTVTVLDGAGAPLVGREVTVEQTRHAFGFGNIGFDFVGLANGETRRRRRERVWGRQTVRRRGP